MNQNFENLRNAVNDNDARLDAVEAGKQQRITGQRQPGSAVTAVGADGSVTCGAWRASEVVVNIGHDAFRSLRQAAVCEYVSSASIGYFLATETRCEARAPLQLPQGVEITGFSCVVQEVGFNGARTMDAVLYRSPADTIIASEATTIETLATTNPSTGVSISQPPERLVGQMPAAPVIVDNNAFHYRLGVNFVTAPSDIAELYGCRVTYRY